MTYMTMYDKRLLNRLDQAQQEKYLKELAKQLPDKRDKYEAVDIYHEPLKLLQKRKTLKTAPPVLPQDTASSGGSQ
jgi:hypothetical protein